LHDFEWIIGLLLGAVALSALARRLCVPYPVFLALGGAALAFIPGSPVWTLDPALALALFVAPVLLDAAFDTSLRDLRAAWVPVATLVFVAVVLTTATVAVVVHWMVPTMPWAAAIALGAIVAPPDAAAATAILRQMKLPHRLRTILEGESLLNDASALLIYRGAASTVMLTQVHAHDIAPLVTLALIGSPVVGYVLARLWTSVTKHITDAPSAIILQFVGTFTVWIVAERLGLSGILTIVVYAITIARTVPARTPARLRVPSYAVWDTMVFLLNVVAFMLIGMQIRPIWERLVDPMRLNYILIAAAVLLTVILTRIVWVMGFNAARRYAAKHSPHRNPEQSPTVKGGLVVSWCGMRGIVTLAAAFALPDGSGGGPAFPHRDLILFTAFSVVLGTLLIQGLTLRPLIARLRFDDSDPVGREVGRARTIAYRAALTEIDGDPSETAEVLRLEYMALLSVAGDAPDGETPRELPADPLRRRAIAAARMALNKLRASGEIGDDAYHRLEEEFDWAELSAGNPDSA
jgi:CPA1 family monovalent cation:H+ antiporter